MASPFQQQALQRKIVYLTLVVVLFTAAWVWRRYVVETKAQKLGLLEQTHGDVSAYDRLVELTLTGSRGLATCILWNTALDQQKKNQWNDLELTVRSLTRLQPHFITPWLFQSWNLAYNVSVESDRIRDKYFYITRGIQLLAAGERQNRYHPDLRREIGFYTQHKICLSDENNTLRSLFQLSCIPPVERDPDRLRKADGSVNWEEFTRFCKAHPQLVRRLHSPPLPYDLRREYPKFRCNTAQDLIQFLADNKDVPSLFVDKADDTRGWDQGKHKEDELERFPVLPPQHPNAFDPEEFTQEALVQKPVPDSFDGYTVARAWYNYAQEPLPKPSALPGRPEQIRDRLRERVPRHMSIIIFRSAPARAQSYVAERLEEEGWFDREKFLLTGWFKRERGSRDEPLAVGESVPWAENAWSRAQAVWKKHGRANHLWFEDPAKLKNMQDKAAAFARARGGSLAQSARRPDESTLSAREKELLFAVKFMREYEASRHLTNFAHFLMRAGVEAQPGTITARKLFYQAEQLRLVAQAPLKALEKYEDSRALQGWREVLDRNPEFRNDAFIAEETFEIELKYLRLYRKIHGVKLTRALALEAFLGQAAVAPPLGANWTLLSLYDRYQLLPQPVLEGPFAKDPQGNPYVPESIRDQVLVRRELKKSPPPSQVPPEARQRRRPPGGR